MAGYIINIYQLYINDVIIHFKKNVINLYSSFPLEGIKRQHCGKMGQHFLN